jgi:glycosyltransferase involved in cell wall biosynthesis
MRVLYVSRDYTTHDYDFVSAMTARSYEVSYVRLESQTPPPEQRPLPPGASRIPWPGARRIDEPEALFRLLPELSDIVEATKPDLVHAGPVPTCGFLAAALRARPLVVMSWGSDLLLDADRSAQWTWMTRYALEHADRLVCDSTAVREKARALARIPEDRIVQFPWGVDLQRFRREEGGRSLRHTLKWEPNRVVLSTRSWEDLYGIDVVLESFWKAWRDRPELRLLLLGTGSRRGHVMETLSRHRLDEVVHCPGPVSHDALPAYYQASDIYLSASRSDGTSVSLLEALAVGLSIIVTDIPGNREWIHPGRNGWLARRDDPDAFADALRECLGRPPVDLATAQAMNRALVEEKADWGRNVSWLFSAYEQLAGR